MTASVYWRISRRGLRNRWGNHALQVGVDGHGSPAGTSPMRIAQIAPLAESVPPQLYGGTERVVSWLTEELVALGHDVTLFASGNSRTSAKLEAMWPRALRHDAAIRDPNALHMSLLER